jgi:hypothetical protein
MRPSFALLICFTTCFACSSVLKAADAISLSDRKLISEINQAVSRAGKQYASQDYEAAGQSIRMAMTSIATLEQRSPKMASHIQPAVKRIRKAHALLEFEGIRLPAFEPSADSDSAPTATTNAKSRNQSSRKRTKPKTVSADPWSFTNVIAPILANRCGKCHVDGSRGGFKMDSYAALMSGSPAGVVVFPGDVVGSRLIETIEMPRGGGQVPPQELQALKKWIAMGAKFDGADPTTRLTSFRKNNPARTVAANAKTSMKPSDVSGEKTVSFVKDVAGLLVDNCKGCHIDSMRVRGGLNMDSFASLLRGGDSGSMIQPGNAQQSLLIKRLRGMDGDCMPGGGRPPLSDKQIDLISNWINEGAILDGESKQQALSVMHELAWAAAATPEQLTRQRAELAEKHLGLVASGMGTHQAVQTDHFRIVGTASGETLELVGQQAERQIKTVRSVVSSTAADAESLYRGKATIYVAPRRYDYSEFSKMVERRSVPSGWQSHWVSGSVEAYVSMVATERDDPKEIAGRLTAPLTALAIAKRGNDVPRWFAEGVGVVNAMRNTKLDREERTKLEAELSAAVSAMKDAKTFLGGKMSPKDMDRIGAAIASTLLSRQNRRNYDQLLRELEKGGGFERAFTNVFRATPESFVNTWVAYVRR